GGTGRPRATVERRKASPWGAASHDATRASPARPTLALAGATTITKRRLSALRPPFDSVGTKPTCKTRAQKCAAGTRWAAVAKAMADLITLPPKVRRRRGAG